MKQFTQGHVPDHFLAELGWGQDLWTPGEAFFLFSHDGSQKKSSILERALDLLWDFIFALKEYFKEILAYGMTGFKQIQGS